MNKQKRLATDRLKKPLKIAVMGAGIAKIIAAYLPYPNVINFLDRLSVAAERTDMSFSYDDPKTGLSYATRNLNTLFALRPNRFKPRYWRFLFEIKKFLLQTQNKLKKLNSANHPFFCGSYFGYGFHEDGLKSAIDIGHHFGIEL
jgi:predicted NAD/FAD-binding protein